MRLGDLRRAPAVRWVPFWIFYSGLTVTLAVGLRFAMGFNREEPIGTHSWVTCAWIGVAAYLLFGKTRARCHRLELGLPISARSLWVTHLAAVGFAGTIVAAISVFLVERIRSVLPASFDSGSGSGSLLLLILSGLALAIALMETRQPALAEVPASRLSLLYAVCVVLLVLAVLLLIANAGPVWVLLPFLAAGAVAAAVYRALPAAFLVAPTEAAAAERHEALPARDSRASRAASAAEAPLPGAGSRFALERSLFRLICANSRELFSFFVLLALGAVVGGVGSIGRTGISDRLTGYTLLLIAVSTLYSTVPMRLDDLRFVDHLPISRGKLLAAVLLPSFLPFALGVIAAQTVSWSVESNVELVRLVNSSDDGLRMRVPLRHLSIDAGGNPPAIHSPWGESHTPRRWSLFSGSGAALYSPYSVKPDSSAEFVALQLSRAIESVYGTSVPAEELAARYLVTGPAGEVRAVQPMSLRQDYAHLSPRFTGPLTPALITMVTVAWLAMVGVFMRALGPTGKSRTRIAFYWCLAGGVFASLFLLISLIANAAIPRWLIPALIEIPVYRIGQAPFGTLAAWVVSVLVIAAAYRFALARFARAEIPRQPTRYSLIDWARTAE